MLSIIIPVLDESGSIERLVVHLMDNLSGKTNIELIFVDGGSQDNTREILKNINNKIELHSKFTSSGKNLSINVYESKRGRARQMNFGAKNATGKILYFLHADSYPPKNFDRYIVESVEKGNPAGCFRMKFDSDHWWLFLAGWFTQFNIKAFRGGDQSQFITQVLFEEIGGFDENYRIYEDNILIEELYRRKQFVIIPHILITSARRYREKGIGNLQYHFWRIHLKKFLGADAEELYHYYAKNIGVKNHKRRL